MNESTLLTFEVLDVFCFEHAIDALVQSRRGNLRHTQGQRAERRLAGFRFKPARQTLDLRFRLPFKRKPIFFVFLRLRTIAPVQDLCALPCGLRSGSVWSFERRRLFVFVGNGFDFSRWF